LKIDAKHTQQQLANWTFARGKKLIKKNSHRENFDVEFFSLIAKKYIKNRELLWS
jgi:hypothetical protein